MDSMRLGDLITLFYDEFLAMYGDEELASVATAAAINEILAEDAYRVWRSMQGYEQLAS